MKKIYITTRYLSHGGVEKVVCDLANLFIEMSYDVEILCTYLLEEPVYYLDKKVKITFLTDNLPKGTAPLRKSLKSFSLVKFANDLYIRFYQSYSYNKIFINSIKDIQNSIIISTTNREAKIIGKYSKKSNKLIAQWHSDHKRVKGSLKDIKYKYKNINYLLLLNEELKNEVETEIAYYNQHLKCLTVPNFIINKRNVDNIKIEKQIISVGRLSPEKGFDRLLIIWKKFIVNNQGYILKIVGDGVERENLLQLAHHLNISDSVYFVGYLSNDETVREICKSKLLLMTSISETFGIVLLESMSQGTPVIAYDVRTGPRAIIKDGYNGFLVKENDVETFAEKLEFLLKEDKVYNRMSKNAIMSSENYSKENVKEIWSSILKQ